MVLMIAPRLENPMDFCRETFSWELVCEDEVPGSRRGWIIKLYFGELSHVQVLDVIAQNIEPDSSLLPGSTPFFRLTTIEKVIAANS